MESDASASRSELRDFLINNAVKEFPVAFKLVHTAYQIKEHNFAIDDKVEPIELIEAGRYLHNTAFRNGKPLFAKLDHDDSTVQWYYQVFGHGTQPVQLEDGVEDLFPNEGIARHIGPKGPFSLVAPSSWPTDEAERAAAIKTSRSKLNSLVKFAFILMGKAKKLRSQRRVELLGELEDLCVYIQKTQDDKRVEAMAALLDREHDSQSAQVEDSVALPASRAVPATGTSATSCKRPFTRMSVAVTKDEVSHLSKRVRTMSLPPARHTRTPAPRPVQGPDELENRLNDLVDCITVRKQEEWAAEKDELQGQIESLHAELDDRRKEAREGNELKKKYKQLLKNWNASIQDAMREI